MVDFNTIYHKQFEALYSMALAKGLTGEDVDTVVADAFISYLKNRERVLLGKERAWLAVTLANRIKDFKKMQRRSNVDYVRSMDQILEDYCDEAYDADRDNLYSIMRSLIERLPEKTRRVMQLSLLGYAPFEIAHLTGMSPITIHNQKSAAHKLLRKRIQPYL